MFITNNITPAQVIQPAAHGIQYTWCTAALENCSKNHSW